MNSSHQKRPRVALLGPVFPYRGGVASHTTRLRRALAARCELVTLSFAALYPPRLYPGRHQREPGSGTRREPDVRYELRSMDPFNWIAAGRRLRRRGLDAVIAVWWTAFTVPCLATVSALAGPRRILMCHNLVDHDAAFPLRLVMRHGLAAADAYVVHTRSMQDRLRTWQPDAPTAVYPHPIFDDFPPPARALPRRAALELLFFGFVRPYKGLDLLLEAMRRLEDADVFLSVVGEWWADNGALRRAAEQMPNVERVDRYVSSHEAADFFARADVVVLPYRSATGTGIVPLAYHYRRPVLASRVGGIPDVVDEGRSGRLIPPGDPGALAAAVRDCLRRPPGTADGIARTAARMTWDGLASALLAMV